MKNAGIFIFYILSENEKKKVHNSKYIDFKYTFSLCDCSRNSTQKPFNVKRIHMFSPRPDDMSDCEDMLIMDLDINNEDLVEASSVQVDAGTEIREADELMDDINSGKLCCLLMVIRGQKKVCSYETI